MHLLVGSLLLVVLFFVAYFGVEFGGSYLERRQAAQDEDRALFNPSGAGAFREIYFFLWAAIFWAGFCLLLPLSLSFHDEVSRVTDKADAIQLFFKIAAIPVLLLFLIFYGRRRGYLRWIRELNWPKKL